MASDLPGKRARLRSHGSFPRKGVLALSFQLIDYIRKDMRCRGDDNLATCISLVKLNNSMPLLLHTKPEARPASLSPGHFSRFQVTQRRANPR